jgi:phospholipid/cholesterol/gamma-HCH transport system substrate-binding protein
VKGERVIMESKANYAVVGVFVILFTVIGITVVVWLVGGNRQNSHFKEYIICTNSSVNGLHKDSTVKYKGLPVGRVLDIRISKTDPDYIEIYALIDRSLSIDNHVVANISSNGLTGISYINLNRKNGVFKCPKDLSIKKYPSILAVRSSIDKIIDKLPKTLDKIDKIASSINNMLSPKTQKNFKNLVSNLSEVSGNLNKTVNKFDKLMDNSNLLVNGLNNDALLLNRALNKLSFLLDNVTNDVANFNQTTLKESYDVIKQINLTVIQMKQLIKEIRENPALLIKGRKVGKP